MTSVCVIYSDLNHISSHQKEKTLRIQSISHGTIAEFLEMLFIEKANRIRSLRIRTPDR